jgi:phenylacetate-coenzyme A ligase PaaK-like adenylate-forming protein
MDFVKSFKANLSRITDETFESAALQLFLYQYYNNPLYKTFVDYLRIQPLDVDKLTDIPFLPIEFFKTHEVKTGTWKSEHIFESSGTTGTVTSKHHVEDLDFYLSCSEVIFEQFYGPITGYTFIALLPSYLERNNSSLVFMADHFVKKSKSEHSGFYLKNYSELIGKLQFLKNKKVKVIIIGVTFALLELAEQFKEDLSGMIIMETGGMKGRRKELTQYEVHEALKASFSVENVHTEYGMTELLSQAYSQKDGLLKLPTWSKVLLRDINDPFDFNSKRRTGGVNIIDLANIHSCAFIETKDIGELINQKEFKILGRMDNSEIRGCNLLIH